MHYSLGYIFLKGKIITIQAEGNFTGNEFAMYHSKRATVVDNEGIDLPVGTVLENLDFFLNKEVAYYFDLDTPEEGPYKQWWTNGNQSVECFFRDSLLDGKFLSWHENGQKEYECFYKNGEILGEYKEWNEKGDLIKHTFI